MRNKWIMGYGLLAACLAVIAFNFLPKPKKVFQLIPHAQSKLPYRAAYCAKKIERVKVVHIIPTELNKPVILGPLNPEFVKHARRTLDRFWKGEIVVVVTGNGGSVFPTSDREMVIHFTERPDLAGGWSAGAILYDEPMVRANMKFSAARDDNLMTAKPATSELSQERRLASYWNSSGRGYIGYDRKYGEFWRKGDADSDPDPRPKLFIRSLQDLVAGRCDRMMSRAIDGPEELMRDHLPVGEF